jgi:hypothetical protein
MIIGLLKRVKIYIIKWAFSRKVDMHGTTSPKITKTWHEKAKL